MEQDSAYITEPYNQQSSIFDKDQSISLLEKNRPANIETQSKYPSISLYLIEEAVKSQIMPASLKDKLIRNPNKYSIFFTKFDQDSPTLKQALNNLNYTSDHLNTLSFQQFMNNQPIDSLEHIMEYFGYITNQYHILKEIITEKNQLKRLQNEQLQEKSMYAPMNFGGASLNDSLAGQLNNQSTRKKFHTVNNTKIENMQFSFDDRLEQMKEKLRISQQHLEKKQQMDQEREKELQEQNEKLQKTLEEKQLKVQQKLQKFSTQQSKKKQEQIQSVLQRAQQIQENRKYNMERKMEEKQRRIEKEHNIRLEEIERDNQKTEERKIKYQTQLFNAQKYILKAEEIQEKKIQQLLLQKEQKNQKIKKFQQQKKDEQQNRQQEAEIKSNFINEKKQQLFQSQSQVQLKQVLNKEYDNYEKQERKRIQDVQKYKKKMKKDNEKKNQLINNQKYQENLREKFVEDTVKQIEYDDDRINTVQQKLKQKSEQVQNKHSEQIEKVQINYAVQIMRNTQKQNKLLKEYQEKLDKINKIKQEKEQLLQLHTSFRKEQQLSQSLLL